jgi:ferric iron reductase protein FhuF
VALEPVRFAEHVALAARRWHTDDEAVALSLFVRELTVAVTTAAVTTFARDRRLLDLSMANLACRQTEAGAAIGVVSGDLLMLPGDGLEGRPGAIVVQGDTALLGRLTTDVLDGVVAPIIDAARTHIRLGERHLWGNVALAIANTLTTLGHRVGPRADSDRDDLLAARPELRPTIEVIRVADGSGDTVTFAIRRTCCLLDRVPGAMRCATCSLNDHDSTVRQVARYFVAERRAGYGAPR